MVTSHEIPIDHEHEFFRDHPQIADCCLHQRPLTVMFADMRGFTSVTERWELRDIVDLLNRYYQLTSKVVHQQAGYIFKFLGDGILVAFSNPTKPKAEVRRAYLTSVQLVKAFDSLAATLTRSENLAIGIGLARGVVMLSALGMPPSQEFTVIGDAVNTSSRLASLAQGKQILATSEVQQWLKPNEYHMMGNISLKGKAEPISVYQLNIPSPSKQAEKEIK
jgi:adenylate cyclase